MSFNKRVAFYTLGCKVNQYETESIKNQLLKKEYTETAFEEEADIYIVNSCTVTSVADRKTRNMLRRAKKINPEGIVIVTGCYAQTNSKELLEMEEIDYVIGNSDKNAIVNFIEDIENRTMEKVKNHNIFLDNEYTEYEFATLREMSRAYVKIQDGCNNFCSYCKIPFARGKSRSRKKYNIIKEIEKLVEEKYNTWEWNYGNSPKFALSNELKYPGGNVEFNLNVEKGIIKDIKFFGDFFGKEDVSFIEEKLTGVKHSEEGIKEALKDVNINDYFLNATVDVLVDGIMGVK